MSKIVIRCSLFAVMLLAITPLRAAMLSDYQEEIQKIFMREAAARNQFKKAVQTARLLGYLEFLAPEVFDGFHQCLKREKHWQYLSALKRERLLNTCKARGRTLSAEASPFSTSVAIRPADDKRQEQGIAQIQKELYELRDMLEKISRDMKDQQEKISGALTALQRNIAAISAAQSPRTEESVSSPPQFESR